MGSFFPPLHVQAFVERPAPNSIGIVSFLSIKHSFSQVLESHRHTFSADSGQALGVLSYTEYNV